MMEVDFGRSGSEGKGSGWGGGGTWGREGTFRRGRYQYCFEGFEGKFGQVRVGVGLGSWSRLVPSF